MESISNIDHCELINAVRFMFIFAIAIQIVHNHFISAHLVHSIPCDAPFCGYHFSAHMCNCRCQPMTMIPCRWFDFRPLDTKWMMIHQLAMAAVDRFWTWKLIKIVQINKSYYVSVECLRTCCIWASINIADTQYSIIYIM